MQTPKMTFTAAGDMLIQRIMPTDYEGFDEVADFIGRGVARFFNLETTVFTGDHYGNQFNGGSYLRADPKVLDIAHAFGFNMLSFANNHTFDFSYGGLLDTLENVNRAGFVNAGVGRNLDEAASPAYLDTANGRVALIGMVSTMASPNNVAAMAGRQSRRVPGRPGVNGLRYTDHIELPAEQLKVISEIAECCGINNAINISRKEGYTLPKDIEDSVEFGSKIKFVPGEKAQYRTHPHKADMQRLAVAIRDAKERADYILVSIHSHEVINRKEDPAEFLVEFAHECIDFGAHAVIGHGPHLLRPLEIYKNRPIFYSLGDFVLQNESGLFQPEDIFEKYSLTSDSTMSELFRVRSANYTRGLQSDSRMLESVIPYFEMENGELTRLELLPIALGFEKPRHRHGDPVVAKDRGILERYAEMSRPYGTKIVIAQDGIGIVELG